MPVLDHKSVDRKQNICFKKKKLGGKKKRVDRGIETLTLKQKRVLEGKLDGLSTTAAIDQAYGYHGGTLMKATEALMSRKPIIDALEAKGVTDDAIAQKIADGLEAKKTVVLGPDRSVSEPDHSARIQYVKEANKVRDNYPSIKIDKTEKVVHISLNSDDVKAMEDFNRMRGAKVVDGSVVAEAPADGA